MLIDKRELQLVDYNEMNDVHFEEVEIVNEIHATILKIENGETLQKELKEKLNGFVEHTIGHFGNEEKLMEDILVRIDIILIKKQSAEKAMDA